MIPSCVPPHKLPGRLASAEDRVEMCRLAFEGDDRAEVSTLELDRGDKSYTVETLREIKKTYPDSELWLIIGSDMLETFTRWYCWEEILALACICAASRKNDYAPDLSAFTPEQRERIMFMEIEPFEVSSTQIRCSRNTEQLLDPKVAEYIKTNKVYDDGLGKFRKVLEERLDEKRLFHSECVSECAASLAERYGADPYKAKLAGLMHDVMKNASEKEQLELIGEMTPLERLNPKVWHQFSGAEFLRKSGLVTDEEIISAVRWHTTGRMGMTLLEKIVYTADFISADRDYGDVDIVRRLAAQSLEHSILYTARYTVNKLANAQMLLHPATVDCYNDMLVHFHSLKGR